MRSGKYYVDAFVTYDNEASLWVDACSSKQIFYLYFH
jgi:hypothetical protein